MRNYVDAEEMMARAYLGLAEDALKKNEKRKDNVLRCCKCGRCNVTLKKLHKEKGLYACTKCINDRAAQETTKEFLKIQAGK